MMDTRIPIAVVGLNFGKYILSQLVQTGASEFFRLAAVCDSDREKSECAAKAHNVRAFYSLDQLLQEQSIPTIGLFTGPVGRAGLVDRIISAGKDVITTKPFESDCEAALEVLQKAQRISRIVHLNSPGPCLSPDLAKVHEWRQQYGLGKPVGCNLSVWAHYREESDGSWYDDPVKCPVAPIFRLGIYLINDLVSIFGRAKKVSVLSSRLFTGRPTADNASLSILFENGAIANIYASFCVEDGDHYRNSMTLNFEKGTVYRNAGAERDMSCAEEAQYDLALVMGGSGATRAVVDRAVLSQCSGAYQWENFSRAVRGEELKLSATPESIVAALRIMDAMAVAESKNGYADVDG